MPKPTSWKYDAARIFGYDAAREMTDKYGPAVGATISHQVARARPGADDWERGYARGTREALRGDARPDVPGEAEARQ
jgi:hypothetical protein